MLNGLWEDKFCDSEEPENQNNGHFWKGHVPSRHYDSLQTSIFQILNIKLRPCLWSCAASSCFFYNTKMTFSWNCKLAVHPKFLYLALLGSTNFHRNVFKSFPVWKMLFYSWANYFTNFTFSSNNFSCAVMLLFEFPQRTTGLIAGASEGFFSWLNRVVVKKLILKN